MVDSTEPICQAIDASIASMLAFDIFGIELYVTENNPKTLNSLIHRLKATIKTILMLALIKWLTASCLHRLLPALTQNSSISMTISTMLINSPSSRTASALSAISPFLMMILRLPILKCPWKRNSVPPMKINPSVILLPSNPSSRISFRSTLISILIPSLVIPLLTQSKLMASSGMNSSFPGR